MARSRLLASIAACAVLIAACSGGGAAAPLTIQLATLNASGVTGSAVLTDLGNGKTKVVVTAVPNGNLSMPAHIHPGTCATLDPKPIYPLNNVENGASTTEIAVKLADIRTGAFALNVHKSGAEAKIYVACGDIPKA
jgi:hypothetical protein